MYPLLVCRPFLSRLQMKKYWNVRSLPELLAKLGLHGYDSLFSVEEIDLALFLTLSEDDLVNIGVSTFGARRKMLLGAWPAPLMVVPYSFLCVFVYFPLLFTMFDCLIVLMFRLPLVCLRRRIIHALAQLSIAPAAY